ncbi:alanine racemase [Planomonospora sp. ID82291]|nr:alanine racemase [Planomonospora sp. ID82291]MBG0818380.1 alanine racemase [Planomonospora sp. ID82291]
MWQQHAERLAVKIVPTGSRWHEPLATVARHRFIPRWWATPGGAAWGRWQVRVGADDEAAWLAAAYRNASLVTQVNRRHADHAPPGTITAGTPTSSSAMPSLAVRMLRHGQVYPGDDLLLVATGSGYSTALAARLLGDTRVTSSDVDPYLTDAATERLAAIGLHVQMLCADGTGPLPGTYDRIVSMTAVRPIPPSWLAALRPGGRLVTVISGTNLLLTATATGDGSAEGKADRGDRAVPGAAADPAGGGGTGDQLRAHRRRHPPCRPYRRRAGRGSHRHGDACSLPRHRIHACPDLSRPRRSAGPAPGPAAPPRTGDAMTSVMTDAMTAKACELAAAGQLPAFVYDLNALDAHVAAIREALGDIEFHYAVKANPDPELLRVLARYVDGFEVASGGELAHVQALFPDIPIALGGPGKTDAELTSDVYRLHVESPGEMRRLLASGRTADVLLRVNLDIPITGAALAMGGGATPFGMDPDGVTECLALVQGQDRVRVHGIHAHLASGLHAEQLLQLASAVVDYARGLGLSEINLGGGMAVSYADPEARFDWVAYGQGLAKLRRDGETLRIEPGRSVTVYCGRYATRVIDVKRVHGQLFAVLAGGTHHIRTPATKGHDQPVVPGTPGEPITLVGQLCTPKDQLSAKVPIALEPGDVVEFAMVGAYAWNISHHDFLMHPHPTFAYVGR